MDKTLPSLAAAIAQIFDGATVMIGGFGGSGAPIELIHALIDRHVATGHPHGHSFGQIDPETVITPGIFVQGLVEVPNPQQEEVLNRAKAVYP